MARFKYTVTSQDLGLELKDIVREHFEFSSRLRNKIKKQKLITLNGEKRESWIKPGEGDVIEVLLPEEKSGFTPEPIPLFPVFEDDDLLIINKQPGLIVHPTRGHPTGTVANGLMNYMEKTGQSFKIRFVNRLDMDTSGLLVVAKNSYCQNDYTRQMRENSVEKRYTAILKGIIEEPSGTVDLPIGRPDPENVARGVMEGGTPSVTHYRVLERFEKSPFSGGYTLAELLLETGRTHQIRVHMSHIGHPVAGDWLYGGLSPLLIDRQALHAAALSFTHPITGERLRLKAPLPEDMKEALEKLRGEKK